MITFNQISETFSVYEWPYRKDYDIFIKPKKKLMKFSESLDTGVCLHALHIVVPLEIKRTRSHELLQSGSSIKFLVRRKS